MLPPAEPVARALPSGEKATPIAGWSLHWVPVRSLPLWPNSVADSLPVVGFHSLMKPLVQPVASTLLSFVQAAQQISPLCAPGTHQPASSTSHARTSPRDSRVPPAEYRIRLSLL